MEFAMRLTCLLILVMATLAQAQKPPVQARVGLNEAVAQQAFQIAENWLKQGAAPKQWDLPLVTGGLTAVRATIRRGGKTFAVATAAVAEPLAKNKTADVMQLVHRAMTEAIAKDLQVLARQQRDAGKPTLDLQFAKSLSSIEVERPGQLLSKFVINRHGLAMHHVASKRWAWSFPGNNIAANTSPRNQLFAMMVPLNIPLGDIHRVGAANNDAHKLYRFEVIHLVQLQPDGHPISLSRGNLLLPLHPFGNDKMADLSNRLMRHLLHRQLSEGPWAGLLKDSLQPGDATYKMTPRLALHNAMAAMALSRAAAQLPADQSEFRKKAERAARRIVEKLLETQIARQVGQDPAVAVRADRIGMTLLAMLDTPGLESRKKDRARMSATLKLMLNPTGQFSITTGPNAPKAQAEAQSIAAAAMVRLYELDRNQQTLQLAQGALVQTWALIKNQDERASVVLPWLTYGEMNLAALKKPSPGHRLAKSVSDKLWLKQLSEENKNPTLRPTEQNHDATGGMVLGITAFNEPNAMTAPVLVTQALALRHGLVNREDPKALATWLVQCGWAVRFLDQLAMAPSSCFYVPNPQDHIGGIRHALWNNRQSLQDSAMALLAISELQSALNNLGDGNLRAAEAP